MTGLALTPPYTKEERFNLYESPTLRIEGSVYANDDRLFLHVRVPTGKFRYKEFIQVGAMVREAAHKLGIEWLCCFSPVGLKKLSEMCGFETMVTYTDMDTGELWLFMAQPSVGV